jgi:CubicO group peptidase (beta-lactamase class C family)
MLELAHVERFLLATRQELRIPGLAIGIIKDHQIIYLRGFGYADETGRPMTPQTPFVLGSLSKSFTALAIMQLVEAGKIDLDAPVQRYLPWFSVADKTASSHITIRHALTHTTGISLYTGRAFLAGRGKNTLEQSVRELERVRLTQPVGTVFQYSNSNYAILGLIVQVIAGERFEAYIQRHIFHPLQMCHSHTSEHEAIQDGMTKGYRWWFGMPFVSHVPYLTDALPAAFILSSAEDMARYLVACLDAGSSEKNALLSTHGFAEMYRPHATIGPNISYALGWRVESQGNTTIIRHGGETANFLSEMVLVPEHRLGIVVLLNVNNGAVARLGVTKIATAAVSLLLGQPEPKPPLSFRTFYLLVDLAVLAGSCWQLWSLVRLFRSRWSSLHTCDLLSLVKDAALPLTILWGIPRWFHAPWSLLRLYVPDLSVWLRAMNLLSFARGIIRIILFFLGNRRCCNVS